MESSKSGYVYVLQMEGHPYYKIGRTINPERRINQISPQMPGRLVTLFAHKVRDAWHREKLLHEEFREFRLNGEWFRLTNKDIDEIRLHLLTEQAFWLTSRLLRRLNTTVAESSSALILARDARTLSRSAIRTARRESRYFAICIEREEQRLGNDILNAEFVG